jgi:Major Facilitator Superfamily
LNLSVANLALPSIGKALGSGQATLDLIAVGYSLGLAASVLYLGALGDRYRRKMMLLIGTGLAIPMSLLAAFAPSSGVLFAARLGAGLAAGIVYPKTLAMITALWSGPARTGVCADRERRRVCRHAGSHSSTASVPVRRAGMASGTADLQRDLRGTIMQPIFGALLTAGYAAAFSAQIRGSNQSVSTTAQNELTKSFSSAAHVAQQYPQYTSQITAAAKTSFLQGDQWAYAAGTNRGAARRRAGLLHVPQAGAGGDDARRVLCPGPGPARVIG